MQAVVISCLYLKKTKEVTSTPLSAPALPAVSQGEQFWNEWILERKGKIESLAEASLASWLKENPVDRSQIEGAKVETIERAGIWVYVRMFKDNRKAPDAHMHNAYFHILFDNQLEVVFQQRGPDAIE